MSTLIWQKSSYSSSDGNTNCIEVAAAQRRELQLRESDEPASMLTPTAVALTSLLREIKAGGGQCLH